MGEGTGLSSLGLAPWVGGEVLASEGIAHINVKLTGEGLMVPTGIVAPLHQPASLSMLFNCSRPQFPHLCNGSEMTVWRIKWAAVCQALGTVSDPQKCWVNPAPVNLITSGNEEQLLTWVDHLGPYV